MAIIKCKMCGGDVELATDKTFGTCEFCGCSMTFPKVDDEQRAAAFNRGNHFRRIGEFDKALAVYERIVREDDTDAEAHWCCALCRFGIEYVEDPATFEYLPTCHRASFDSFLEDVDYLAAVEHSEGITKRQYQKDGAKIAEVQRGILATSQNEEPFDVFICYKESDESGQRTRDSLMAQEVYYQLTDQGYRVFFSRITLEDMAGKQYEPYIFAALNSAKVMLVIGTKPQYFTAVWVKNEWSRFLKLMKSDRSKLLIPCYKDMDAYELPEEFAHLQAQDMSKIGFINDVVRGIRKVAVKDEPKTTVVQETVVASGNANTAPLLKRAFMFLEDGDWDAAKEYCEKVLDIDPECAEAYLGKLMAEQRVKKQENLKDQAEPFDQSNHYQKALRFADETLKKELTGYIEHINTRNENTRLAGIYNQAKNTILKIKSERTYKEAAYLFESISGYLDSAVLAQECLEKAEEARKDKILAAGIDHMKWDTIVYYEGAIRELKRIPGWKDADHLRETCEQKITELKEKAEANRLECERKAEEARKEAEHIAKLNKKIAIIVTPILCAIIVFIIVLNAVIIPNGKYNDAIALMEAGKYSEAVSAFESLDGYKDSADKINECKYNNATALMDAGEYTEAGSVFAVLDGYRDSAIKVNECNKAILDGKYDDAIALMNAGKYTEAIAIFVELGAHKDSESQVAACKKSLADNYASKGDAENAIKWYEEIGEENAANKVRYEYVKSHKNNTNTTTYEYLKALKEAKYKDSAALYAELYKVKISLAINTSYKDKTTNRTEINTETETTYLYVHFKVEGGFPGQTITLRCDHDYWGGTNNEISWSDYESTSVNASKYDYFPLICGYGSNVYKHEFKIYLEETGELLATQTVLTPYK